MAAPSIYINIISKDKSAEGRKKAEKGFMTLTKKIQGMSLVQAASFALIAAKVGDVINKFAEADKRVREIGTLLNDFSDSDVAGLTENLDEMSVKYAQSFEAMAKARYDIISAGFNTISDSAVLLESSSRLATAGLTSVAKSADLLTTILNAYGRSASYAERAGDVLFETVRLGKTTIDELTGVLGRVVSVAPTVGVSLEEVGAAMAALTAAGLSTEEAGVGLTALFAGMLKPSKALAAEIERLGFSSAAAMNKTIGLSKSFELLIKNVGEAELAARFPNMRAMRSIFPLADKAAKKFADGLSDIRNNAGAMGNAMEKIVNSPAFRLEQAQKSLEVASRRMGESLSGVIELMAGFANLVASIGPRSIAMFAKLTVSVVGTVVALKSIATAIVAIKSAMDLLKLNPWYLLGTAIAAVAVSLGGLEYLQNKLTKTTKDYSKELKAQNTHLQDTADKLVEVRENTDEFKKIVQGLDAKEFDNVLGIMTKNTKELQTEIEKLDEKIRSINDTSTASADFLLFNKDDLEKERQLLEQRKSGFESVISQMIDTANNKFDELNTKPPVPLDPTLIPLVVQEPPVDSLFRVRNKLQKRLEEKSLEARVEYRVEGEISAELQKEILDVKRQVDVLNKVIDEVFQPKDITIDAYEAALGNLVSITEETYGAMLEEGERFAQSQVNQILRRQEAEKALKEQYLMSDYQLQVMALENLLTAIDENWQQRLDLMAIYNEKTAEMSQKNMEQVAQKIHSVSSQFTGALTSLFESNLQTIRNKINKVVSDLEKQRDAQIDIVRQQYTVEGKLTKEGEAEIARVKEEFKRKEVVATFRLRQEELAEKKKLKFAKKADAVSNIALAVTKALAAAPPPFNYALAAAVGAAGAAQISVIDSSEYAQGGIVGSDNNKKKIFAFAPTGTDTVPAVLTPGEIVLSRDKVDQLSQSPSIMSSLIDNTPPITQRASIGGDDSAVLDDSGIVNLTFNINAIDSQGVKDFLESDDFLDNYKDILRRRLLTA